MEEVGCGGLVKKSSKRRRKKNGDEEIRLAEKTATAPPRKIDDRPPLFCCSLFIHPQFLPPLITKSPVSPRSGRSQLGRTCASAAGLLLGKAEAEPVEVFFANARGAEAVLLPATPRADDDAVLDEACIASISRERGVLELNGDGL